MTETWDQATPGRSPEPAPSTTDLKLSRTIARFSDDLITIPGVGIGVGADALVGLIPGIGDLLGTGLSTSIMIDAVRNRVPLPVLARMGWNMLLDAGLGMAPVVGDVADVLHRANRRNYRLLEQTVAAGQQVHTSVPGYLALATLTVIGFAVIALTITAVIIWGVVRTIGGLIG
ncbi:MAG: DUF4112 domain-containing protein [Propioniciclava sp.]